ncbi:MAG: LysR substrate-binding domain-containing protein, partial [Beijerinckiaceae bacterium]
ISIAFIAEDRNASFERREADIAIRFAGPEDPVALMTRLGSVTFRRYRAHSAAGDPAPIVRYADDLSHLPEMRLLDALRPGAQPVARTNRLDILKEAAASLAGEAMLPEQDGDRDGRFQRADPEATKAERPLFLLVHPDRRNAPSVSAVVDWIKSIHAGYKTPG